MGKLVQGEWMGTDGDTQPTDTEMLDWMIEKKAAVITDRYSVGVRMMYSGVIYKGLYPTPRQAIAAEMMKENK